MKSLTKYDLMRRFWANPRLWGKALEREDSLPFSFTSHTLTGEIKGRDCLLVIKDREGQRERERENNKGYGFWFNYGIATGFFEKIQWQLNNWIWKFRGWVSLGSPSHGRFMERWDLIWVSYWIRVYLFPLIFFFLNCFFFPPIC